MEYQKMINLLDNMPNQPSKFRTKDTGKHRNSRKPKHRKNIIIKNCAPFTDCMSEINKQIHK